MSLSKKRRRRKHEQGRHRESRSSPPPSAAHDPRAAAAAATHLSPERLFAERERDATRVVARQEPNADDGSHSIAAETSTLSPELRQAEEVERLAYTRRQAAEALGVSISTIDRYVVPVIETIKAPWGQRLIPVDGLERFMRDHREPARGRPDRRRAGRPTTLPRSVVERIRLEYARGRGLSEIARALTAERVPTAHGGRKWWPSTVRAVLIR